MTHLLIREKIGKHKDFIMNSFTQKELKIMIESNGFWLKAWNKFATLKNIGFIDWLESDNVIRYANNVYSTQCAQYRNRLNAIELINYYTKEYTN